MDHSFYIEQINKLKKDREAVILAHNYQRAEVQEIADYTGDSFGLARQAAGTTARVIVFCGVHFMAETAYILNPGKMVLLPEPRAGCPLADMVTADDVEQLKAKHPGAPVVCYVNSSAAVKAVSDICCTSANAVAVVEGLPDEKVIFVPDGNLGRYVADRTGKEIVLWPGYCPTHDKITREQIIRLKQENEGAVFMAHPECRREVLALADHVCSTSGMYDYARSTPAETIILGSEQGMLHRLRRMSPTKTFLMPSNDIICPNMKLTTLKKVYLSLLNKETPVELVESIRVQAEEATVRMMAVAR
ncbi:MAG: quinolinate synthase NadA [Actinomycetota bacterium]|nr:quinolinate synthase NadA [Actinomycetota bacterium]